MTLGQGDDRGVTMKLIMDERIKYRLTGLVVILAMAALFIPAIVKNSNHHFAENVKLAVRLPAKPRPPNVQIPSKKVLFQTVKKNTAALPKVTPQPSMAIAKATLISTPSQIPAVPQLLASTLAKSSAKSSLVPVPQFKASSPVLAKKEVYAVQLASFVQQNNAASLVTHLRSKGYIASYNKYSGKRGDFYKVMVGQVNQKEEALHLQQELATSMKLNGFIVKQG
jgi:DedD protein